MSEAEPNYFTCTLGEAVILKKQNKIPARSFYTVVELIENQAKCRPESLALGFANPFKERPDLVSFAELDKLSRIAAAKLRETLAENSDSFPTTVGLFSYSSLELVLSWLGLLRLGSVAFFFAPQLGGYAIEHLCSEADVRVILVDKDHKDELLQFQKDIRIVEIPDYSEKSASEPSPRFAFLGHTSGTSSGLPKPISQTEWGAVGCLPVFSDPNPKATFTTTPLYHGGLADALRAWTSGAMIWFFPEGSMPITGNNIVQTVGLARRMSGMTHVKYFSSVPYVLQLLAEVEEDAGVEMLASMELVGVGGAPLSPIVGDRLVKSGVKLLSRMGSTECGFVMSSHREFTRNREWQYLIAVDNPEFLTFEPRENGLSELVVAQRWPLRLTTNRENGSYGTGDLFEAHPRIPNAWRYHGRDDTLIILANGKKFDPSPMEDELVSSNKMLIDVLVFGAGRDYAGALLFVKRQNLPDNEYLEKIWPDIQKLNQFSARHARLARSTLVILQVDENEERLPKTSKGTILRHQAESRYADAIEQAYTSSKTMRQRPCISDEELVPFISEVFDEVLGRHINPEKDVYEQGVDSIACVQIMRCLQATLLSPKADLLPRNIIYNNGNILELAMTLKQIRQGKSCLAYSGDEVLEHMQCLANKYGKINIAQKARIQKPGVVVVLTGATGALGAHILNRLIDDSSIMNLYCLLRGQSPLAARRNIVEALIKWRLRSRRELEHSDAFRNKVVCLLYDLSASNIGISNQDRSCIVNNATHIIHSAWTVNFNLELRSFEKHLASTRNLVEVACASGAEFFFISSIAAVNNARSRSVPESVSSEPRDASASGYSQSKWVAEQICAAAHVEVTKANRKWPAGRPVISIIRAGQLCGNKFGVWNASEAYPLMLSTAKLTSCLPDLPGESLNWLPVDVAAKSIIEIALPHSSKYMTASRGHPDIAVYHVLNPHMSPSWHQMLEWISYESGTNPFEIVSVSAWMQRLEDALKADALKADAGDIANNRCQALITSWKQRYMLDKAADTIGWRAETHKFDVNVTQQMSRSVRDLKQLNRQDVVRMWKWIQESC
ncbi:hypothetical protein GGS21DRAFT_537360 [Xylaria nigripes]|nr:hypothetical protein GGS21DRAFT_537360 [Xylaria nigripes]